MDFVSNLSGTLVRLEEDENSRFRYEIWFDYTRQAINQIREGAMLGVPNFASTGPEQHISILELVTVLPMHYALSDGRDLKGFPGFVVEAAKSIVNDWEEQESESTEDTTKIRCIAIPTNLEVVQSGSSIGGPPELKEESNLPMLGSAVRVFDTEFTNFIANNGIGDTENTFIAGNLIRDENVRIKVRIEDLLKTHFGIFGFTGAGKSNLTSTLLSQVLSETSETVKLLFFDLMGEYTTLLIDQLLNPKLDSYLVCLGTKTLPEPVFRYINADPGASLDDALRSFARYTLLPKALKGKTDLMTKAYRRLLVSKRIKVFSEVENLTLGFCFFDKNSPCNPTKSKSRQAAKFGQRVQLLKEFAGRNGGTSKNIDKTNAKLILDNLTADTQVGGPLAEFAEDMKGTIEYLQKALPELEKQLNCSISLKEIVGQLNDKERSGLLVFNAHNPNELRTFSHKLGSDAYESRRRSGEIEPMCSFIFDEADEFIPREGSGSYDQSREIVTTLARRGRKFGLGIGIATQRVRYLDTSIMAQPHTYFVSKMPRRTDREVVAEAFGISEDMFRQTFKFRKGDWLLMSYDATGLEAIPLPVHCFNANDRIEAFLKTL
jgi:uncharacterized protein